MDIVDKSYISAFQLSLKDRQSARFKLSKFGILFWKINMYITNVY